jgi:hypothetical protein
MAATRAAVGDFGAMGSGDTSTAQTLQQWLTREVAAVSEGGVLLLGDAGAAIEPARAAIASPLRWVREVHGTHDLPLEQGRFALAAAVGVFERLDQDTAAAVLAALRDRCARRVLTALPAVPWTAHEMRAFGFDALGQVDFAGTLLAAYGFDIDRYKRAPDWLDARHWANPELWGRFRW